MGTGLWQSDGRSVNAGWWWTGLEIVLLLVSYKGWWWRDGRGCGGGMVGVVGLLGLLLSMNWAFPFACLLERMLENST